MQTSAGRGSKRAILLRGGRNEPIYTRHQHSESFTQATSGSGKASASSTNGIPLRVCDHRRRTPVWLGETAACNAARPHCNGSFCDVSMCCLGTNAIARYYRDGVRRYGTSGQDTGTTRPADRRPRAWHRRGAGDQQLGLRTSPRLSARGLDDMTGRPAIRGQVVQSCLHRMRSGLPLHTLRSVASLWKDYHRERCETCPHAVTG